MQALSRMMQKSINMEIKLLPKLLSYDPREANDGEPCQIFVRVVRGPLTWQTKKYSIESDNDIIDFNQEEFVKKSGFYFTKDGAEFKKATISILKVKEGSDPEELASNDINLSGLISPELLDRTIRIGKDGFKALRI